MRPGAARLPVRPAVLSAGCAGCAARLATCSPWLTSRTFSDTRSHARSLLSRPRFNNAGSRERCSCCSRIRIAQMSLGLNGAFCPTSLPLFHGSLRRVLDEVVSMIGPPVRRRQAPPMRTVAGGASSIRLVVSQHGPEHPLGRRADHAPALLVGLHSGYRGREPGRSLPYPKATATFVSWALPTSSCGTGISRHGFSQHPAAGTATEGTSARRRPDEPYR